MAVFAVFAPGVAVNPRTRNKIPVMVNESITDDERIAYQVKAMLEGQGKQPVIVTSYPSSLCVPGWKPLSRLAH